mmetsp:Transcript_17460/g.47761  ORF Transcript_17460/g.47761 Transcript_17460/m.47761 type:complete len:277 (+) Transcript_17460:1223-2053(+)
MDDGATGARRPRGDALYQRCLVHDRLLPSGTSATEMGDAWAKGTSDVAFGAWRLHRADARRQRRHHRHPLPSDALATEMGDAAMEKGDLAIGVERFHQAVARHKRRRRCGHLSWGDVRHRHPCRLAYPLTKNALMSESDVASGARHHVDARHFCGRRARPPPSAAPATRMVGVKTAAQLAYALQLSCRRRGRLPASAASSVMHVHGATSDGWRCDAHCQPRRRRDSLPVAASATWTGVAATGAQIVGGRRRHQCGGGWQRGDDRLMRTGFVATGAP